MRQPSPLWCKHLGLTPTLSLKQSRGPCEPSGDPSCWPNCWPADPQQYQLLYVAGKGGASQVFRAICTPHDATCAVKRLDLDSDSDLAALVREASLMRRFAHNNVLELHTSFVVGRELWLVMPFMDLGSVRGIMRRAFPCGLSEVLIATIMRRVLLGLEHVHKHGGIHRDIKADNILVSSSGEVRLADFGVAAARAREVSMIMRRLAPHDLSSERALASGGSTSQPAPPPASVVRASTFVGTPCWMAPEVMEQLEDGYDSAADIWSIGITLIELATGRPPLAQLNNPLRVLVETLSKPPPTLGCRCASGRKFSKALQDLVARCLQRDPAARPSAAQLLAHRFFRHGRDTDHLVSQLLAGLLAAEAAGPRGAASVASAPSTALRREPSSAVSPSTQPGSRAAHSEPVFLARLRGMLGLAQASTTAAAQAQPLSPRRLDSRWLFTARSSLDATGLPSQAGLSCSALAVTAECAGEGLAASSAAAAAAS